MANTILPQLQTGQKLPSIRSHTRPWKGFAVLGMIGAVVVSLLVAHYRSEERKEELEKAQSQAAEEQTRLSILKFAAEYNAVTDWRSGIARKNKLYSAELSDVLVRGDAPILFIASAKDVTSQASGDVLVLSAWANILTPLRLELRSPREISKEVMRHRDVADGEYAVIARIELVTSGEETSRDENGQADTRPISVAQGQCIGVMWLGKYFGEFNELISRGLAR